MSSLEGYSDGASAGASARPRPIRIRLLPAVAALLLAVSPFVAWAHLELHGVWESSDGVGVYDPNGAQRETTRVDGSELAGDLNLFELAVWSGYPRVVAAIPLVLAAFVVHAIVRANYRPARLIVGGLLFAAVCGVLYATLIYWVKEYFTNYPDFRYGLLVAIGGSVALIADAIWITVRRPHRGGGETPSPS